MAKKKVKNPVDYVSPLNINGLEGRVLKLPAPGSKKREILLLYGSHSSLERMFSLASELNKYGAVTMPDWPGFGGMDNMFKIDKKPTVDTMADYLAAFVKMRYRRRRFTIIGMSYGFAVATRMLQKYPEIAQKVDLAVSIVGFAHKDDFIINPRTVRLMRFSSKILSSRVGSSIARVLVNDITVGTTYRLRARSHHKMKEADEQQQKAIIEFEKVLWRINHLRTYFFTGNSMLNLDLCTARTTVPVVHVAVAGDHFFDNQLVEQHFAIIYPKVTVVHVTLNAHMPTIVASAEEVAPFVPPQVRRMLGSR